MNARTLLLGCLVFALMAPSVIAPPEAVASEPVAGSTEAVVGTWSGQWDPEGDGIPDGVTIQLELEEQRLRGGILGYNAREFVEVFFDPEAGKLVVETAAADSETPYRIEATVDGTRMNGFVARGDVQGELKLTKWTYKPRYGFGGR